WRAFRTSGLSMAAFSPALGGTGLCAPENCQTLCTILRLIGAADLSMARLFEGHVNAIMLVTRYGTSQQVVALAQSVEGGALSGVWGAEGPERLQRNRCGDAWSLEGKKVLASGAGFLTHPLVPVATEQG